MRQIYGLVGVLLALWTGSIATPLIAERSRPSDTSRIRLKRTGPDGQRMVMMVPWREALKHKDWRIDTEYFDALEPEDIVQALAPEIQRAAETDSEPYYNELFTRIIAQKLQRFLAFIEADSARWDKAQWLRHAFSLAPVGYLYQINWRNALEAATSVITDQHKQSRRSRWHDHSPFHRSHAHLEQYLAATANTSVGQEASHAYASVAAHLVTPETYQEDIGLGGRIWQLALFYATSGVKAFLEQPQHQDRKVRARRIFREAECRVHLIYAHRALAFSDGAAGAIPRAYGAAAAKVIPSIDPSLYDSAIATNLHELPRITKLAHDAALRVEPWVQQLERIRKEIARAPAPAKQAATKDPSGKSKTEAGSKVDVKVQIRPGAVDDESDDDDDDEGYVPLKDEIMFRVVLSS